jgi:hypothetical protein
MRQRREADMLIKDLEWKEEKRCDGDNTLYVVHTDLGRITVLDRITGWGGGLRGIETGYKDKDGRFWLALDRFDIRRFPNLTLDKAIELIKKEANIRPVE